MSDNKKTEAAIKLKDSTAVIKRYLESDKKYRDDDRKLTARVWSDQLTMNGHFPDRITATDMLILLAKGELVDSYVIERLRRKLQKDYPELRGEKWQERHKQARGVKGKINE